MRACVCVLVFCTHHQLHCFTGRQQQHLDHVLAWARALAIDPSLLLLDEPCSGLDDAESALLGSLLRELAGEGRAVLIVEHDMDAVFAVANVLTVMVNGNVLESGAPERIRSSRAVQEAYLGVEEE